MQCRGWEFQEVHRDCLTRQVTARVRWAPLGDSPEAQAGARGTEDGTGGESKEEEKKGQPSPLFREDCRGYSAFQYILHSQAPETTRCASRFALTPQKESLGHSGLGSPRGAWERANPPKSLFRTLGNMRVRRYYPSRTGPKVSAPDDPLV
jgi:hypothetical protein